MYSALEKWAIGTSDEQNWCIFSASMLSFKSSNRKPELFLSERLRSIRVFRAEGANSLFPI
ncbi:MAG: hypothetical protein IKD75_05600 [Prevotella sp.]|nr:hypothetical protein [Prevotella sp.]